MKHSEILIEARRIITNPEHWTQGEYARRINGEKEFIESIDAFCFCSVGAIRRAYKNITGMISFSHIIPTLAYVMDEMGIGVPDYNDTHTHEEVLAQFDEAILKAQEDETL